MAGGGSVTKMAQPQCLAHLGHHGWSPMMGSWAAVSCTVVFVLSGWWGCERWLEMFQVSVLTLPLLLD